MTALLLEQAPTLAAVLELRQERDIVYEAYDFLDEKRLLLAAEILRQIERYEALLARLQRLRLETTRSLADAVARHGVAGLSVYPATALEGARLANHIRSFMGVSLSETHLELPSAMEQAVPAPSNPSPEAERCRSQCRELLELEAEVAGVSGNLRRLFTEYRNTERRARALENVVLPEIEQVLNEMTTHLEELDQEEAIRVRLPYGEIGRSRNDTALMSGGG